MVLRKPYAFLIKYFRLIHLIITAILLYTVLKMRDISGYINKVIANTPERYNAQGYINYGIFVYIVIAIILCFFVYFLLKYKDKPRNIYIVTIVGYILVMFYVSILFGYMSGFSNIDIDQKTIRFYRDILTMTLWFQYYMIIVMGIRGLGFDIKRFDFRKDMHELNMTDSDAEEIEVNTQLNTTNVLRAVRKGKREFGYFYKEYKWYIITILTIICVIVGKNVYNYLYNNFKIYNETDIIGGMYNISINKSYYRTDRYGNNYIVIKFDISKYGSSDKFNYGNMTLSFDGVKYTPDKNICYKFSRLGNCYKKQIVSSDTTNYILSYKVDALPKKDAYIIYNESYNNSYKVKLSMVQY